MNITKLFRTSEWLLAKLMFNFGFVLVVFIFTKPSLCHIGETFALLILYIVPTGALGYYINDFFDAKIDIITHKKNHTSSLSSNVRIFVFLVLLGLCGIPILILFPYPLPYLYLIAIQIILFLMYSAPPLRLKRNVMGLLCDSLFSFVLPALISVFIAYRHINIELIFSTPFLLVAFWLFCIGLRSILLHQIKDYDNDKAGNEKTFTLQIGKTMAIRIAKRIFVFEALSLIIFGLLLSHLLGLAILAAILLYALVEVLICYKNMKSTKIFNGFISEVNVFYNYYIVMGIAILLTYEHHYYYALIVMAFMIIRLRKESKSVLLIFYHKFILYFYYKFKGLIKRMV